MAMKNMATTRGPNLLNTHLLILPLLLLFLRPTSADDETLFFSSYVEGSGYNKAFGIYNPMGSAADLHGSYAVQGCYNGCSEEGQWEVWLEFPEGAALASGEEYVVCSSDASLDPLIGSVCQDQEQYMSNGNDAVRLVQCSASDCGGSCGSDCDSYTVLDSIGDFHEEAPAAGWPVCGVTAATKDHTLLRFPSACSGSGAGWDVEEKQPSCTWEVHPKDSEFGEIGFHATSGCTDDGGRKTRAPVGAPTLSPTPGLVVQPATMCPAAPAEPEDRRVDKSRLRLGQWNMDFLMLPEVASTGSMACPCAGLSCADASLYSGCQASNCCGWGRLDATAHLRYVATEVTKIDADVLHVVEVGDCSVLQALLELLPEGHGYKAYMVENHDTFTGEHVGLLTRVDPVEDLRYDDRRVAYPVSAGPPPVDDDDDDDDGGSGGVDDVDSAKDDDGDDDDASSKTTMAQLPEGSFTPSDCAVLSGASGDTGTTKHLVARLLPVEFAGAEGSGGGEDDDEARRSENRRRRGDDDDDDDDDDDEGLPWRPPRHLTVVGVHTLARPDDVTRCARREAQAALMATIAAEAVAGRGDHVMIVGDMNDFDPDAPQASGIAPITNALAIMRNASTLAAGLASGNGGGGGGGDDERRRRLWRRNGRRNGQQKKRWQGRGFQWWRRRQLSGGDDDHLPREEEEGEEDDDGAIEDDDFYYGDDDFSYSYGGRRRSSSSSSNPYAPLLNVVELLAPEERYSEWWDQNGDCVDDGVDGNPKKNEYSQLDHMLLSSGLAELIVPGSAKMHHDWGGMCLRDGGLYSDHWPLTVDLHLPGFDGDDGGGADDREEPGDCSAEEKAAMHAAAVAATLGVFLVILVLVVVILWKKAGCSGCDCGGGGDAFGGGVFAQAPSTEFDADTGNPLHGGGGGGEADFEMARVRMAVAEVAPSAKEYGVVATASPSGSAMTAVDLAVVEEAAL